MSSEPASAAGPPKDLPAVIGAYRVVREMGRGRLGAVVLAVHRPSGARVALRVLRPEWACLPKYVARLTRDAFAAAQVGHPNVARLDEFGESQGRVYFAAEFIDGPSLAATVAETGALTAPRAVAHVLQAARGLRFAHGQGLTHGDVRPENLFVDRDGLTRLADLGLSRTPAGVEADEARESQGPVAAGAEAQAEADAAPFRADARGLGLTLARLLTGKADAHPTALIACGLPMNLVELVRGLVDPKPGSGSADLGRVVPALERFLNGRGAAGTTPREEDTAVLTECVRAFRASPAAGLRRRIVWGAVAACAGVVLLALLARKPLFAGSVLGLGLMTALADFVVAGLTRKAAPFPKARALVLESRGGDWLIGLAALAVFAAALVALNLHGAWIAFGVLAVTLAAWLHVAVDGKAAAERRGAVEEARALLKRLRLQGVGEETLWGFVRSAAGVGWEPVFEALFGFEALRAARDPSERGLLARLRARSVPWREGLAAWVDDRRASRRRGRDWALIQAIEERGLVAEGVNLLTARRKARRIAEALLAVAAEIRAASRAPAAPTGAEVAPRPSLAWAIRRAAEAPEDALAAQEPDAGGPNFAWVGDLLYGPRTRFLVGSALLAGFLLWVHQNRVISEDQLKEVATRALEAPDSLRDARVDVRLDGATEPLRLRGLPLPVARLLNGFQTGAAGLILVLSSLRGGWRVACWAVAGAAFALLGPPLGVPPTTAMAVGAGAPAAAVLFGWARGD